MAQTNGTTSLSNGYKDVKVVLNGSPETNPKIKGF